VLISTDDLMAKTPSVDAVSFTFFPQTTLPPPHSLPAAWGPARNDSLVTRDLCVSGLFLRDLDMVSFYRRNEVTASFETPGVHVS